MHPLLEKNCEFRLNFFGIIFLFFVLQQPFPMCLTVTPVFGVSLQNLLHVCMFVTSRHACAGQSVSHMMVMMMVMMMLKNKVKVKMMAPAVHLINHVLPGSH